MYTYVVIVCSKKLQTDAYISIYIPFITDVVASYRFGSCTTPGSPHTFRWDTGDGPPAAAATAAGGGG